MFWWNKQYRLQDDEPGDDGKAGGAETPPSRTIPADILPEEMRDMSEQEIRFFLSRTLSGVRSTNDENKELRQRLAALEGRVNSPPPPPEPDPNEGKSITELMQEDPEAAIVQVAKKRGWLDGMATISSKADQALFSTVAGKLGSDFVEYEDEVRQVLRDANAPVTEDTIEKAYDMVIGKKTREARALAARKAQNPENAKPTPPEPGTKLPDETELERTIREAHGKSREDWEKNKSDDFGIKLPLGR